MRIFERLPLWSLFLAGFLICVLSWYPGHDWGGDFAAYLQQARVLVEGGVDTWAEDVRFTVENSDISFGPAFYGWGFPLLLAPVYAIFGLALTAYKVLMSLLLLGAGFFAWRLFRDGLSLPYTWLALAILLLSPTLVEFTNTINSDFAFLFASFGVLLMIETWRQRTLPLKWGAAIGLGVFFAAWIRPNGVLLLAPVGVVVLLRLAARDRRGMLYAAWPAMLAVGLLLAAGLVLPVDRSDLAPALARGLANPWENLLYYLEEGGGLYQRGFGRILFWASIPVALLGTVRDLRRRWPVHLVGALTLLLYLLWPAVSGLRFLFPLVPIYCFTLGRGLQFLGDLRPALQPMAAAFGVIVIVHLVVMHVERIPLQSDRVVPGPETPWAKELWEFVAETDEAAVFTFRKPRVLQLYGGRRAIWSREWDTARSEYLIELLEYGPTQAVPVGGATLLFENEGFRVYRRPDGN